jgi:hypothetical protein
MALIADGSVGAAILYQGVVYRMDLVGDCDPPADGSFSIWAATLDSNGKPGPKAPHLYAQSEADWSVIDFYPGLDDRIIRIYREGDDKFGFNGGRLEFDGPIDLDTSETVKVAIACPG